MSQLSNQLCYQATVSKHNTMYAFHPVVFLVVVRLII